ncbi:YrhC family protein [Bacillus pinisoli]|uniref:YrhC family protein n=1 Tax=Bacillus pinisoli TaxID=2901866 RepID=UPI001FF1D519
MNLKEIKDKITDFNRFGMVLLAVSVFLFIGVLIPSEEGREMTQMTVMMASTIVLLIASFLFFKKAVTYKKKISELEE